MKKSHFMIVAAAMLAFFSGCATQDNFSVSDQDRDGKLSKSEVERALLTAIYAKGDPDGDGKISFAEYSQVDPDYPESRFKERDLDGDGYVTSEELDQFAEKNHSFDALIASMDLNGDGYVDRDEAEAFNERLMAQEGDNELQKLYNLNVSLSGK